MRGAGRAGDWSAERLAAGRHIPSGRTALTNKERRLDEREASIRIERTGRGRFELQVDGTLALDRVN